MSKETATSFLHKNGKTLPRRRRAAASAIEECCIEGCTLQEISEYKCH